MPRRLLRIHPDGSRSGLDEPRRAGAASGGDRVTVVVPAEDVLLLETPRVPGPESTLARALPYAIEDQLAVPVETQHVAWAALDDPARVAVAVVERGKLEGWLAALRADGIEPDEIIPEGLLLPWREGRVGLLVEGRRAVARLGRMQAFCGDLDEVLALLPADEAGVERIDVAAPGSAAAAGLPAGRAIEVYARALAAGPRPLVNLLQGGFAPRARRAGLHRAWRLAGVAGLVAFALALAHVGIERSQLAAQVDAQRAEMAGLYRQLVPDATEVASPEAFLASALRAAGQAELPLLESLGALGRALAGDGCCTLMSLEYRNQVLDAVVAAPDVAALDGLRGRLAAEGQAVELAAATPGSRGVEGRLRIGGVRP